MPITFVPPGGRTTTAQPLEKPMIICTTLNDSLLLELLLDCMTVPAERIAAPAGAAVFIPEVTECLSLYADLDLCTPTTSEMRGLRQGL